ncbi:hypothetical protein I4U23_022149 [Adineta vaga]|nr:hypothetical protein I4U23_022149 [Adineta vaga]
MACCQVTSHYLCVDFDCFDTCLPTYCCVQRKIPRSICKSQSLTNATNKNKSLTSTTQTKNPLGNTNNQKDLKSTKLENFSIQVDITGYDRNAIKTKIEDDKLIVEAKYEDRQQDDDFTLRQFRKTYPLPKHVDPTRMTTRVTSDNKMLIIEIPNRNNGNGNRISRENSIQSNQSDGLSADYLKFLTSGEFHPRIVDKGDNKKVLELTFDVKNCPPEEINVSVKDNFLIIQGEHIDKETNHSKRNRFSRSTTLPVGAQVDQMTSVLGKDGQMKIEIPFILK